MTAKLPEWYMEDLATPSASNAKRSSLSVRKALASIGEALARELSGIYVHQSWLSSIEPRARLIGILALIFASTFMHGLVSLSIFFGSVILGLFLLKIPVSRVGKVWLGVPIFSLAIILPATLNIVTKGPVILHVYGTLAVTSAGLVVAARFLLRILICVTLSYMLVSSAESAVLVNSLRRIGMPRIFGMVLTMMQRYLAVMLRAAEEIHLARLSRPSGESRLRDEHKWVAAGMGILFRRTYRLADEVGLAMTSRGYDGDVRLRHESGWRTADTIWLIGICAFIACLIAVDMRLS